MEKNFESLAQMIADKKSDEISLPMLTSTLGFLMTRFVRHQCPKLAQFIVRHLRLVVEHPEVAASPNCQTLYLELLGQWQVIAALLLESDTRVRKTRH